MALDDAAADLVRRVRDGDATALDELYRLYLVPLYGYMVVGLHDHHAAEDAAHEVFVRVLRALERYEERGVPFRIWLFRIARNYLLDTHRRARPEDSESPERLNALLELRSLATPSPLTRLGDEEFLRVIQILPLVQRQVLVLRFVFDMSFAEIATVLGATEGAVRTQQWRAFSTLRPHLLRDRDAAGDPSISPLAM